MRAKQFGLALRLCAVLLFACLFVISHVWKSSAQQPTAAAKPSPTPPPPLPPDAPVEQTRKNIQVLKGVTESQLYNLMNYVSVSLGVQCTYCHVTAGKRTDGTTNWVWESDEKPQKVAARRMMLMTMQLNQTNLADFHNQRVTCYTCHRGSTDPARLVPLPVAKSGHEPIPNAAAQADAAQQPTKPTPEEILARYVAAVGGRDAIARAKTVVMRGTREASQGRVWPLEISMEGADKFAVLASIPAQGQQPASEVRQVYAGGKGWTKSPQGVREVTPAELPGVRNSILLLAPVKIAEPFPAMTYGGVSEVGGRETYVLVAKPDADTTVRYYFDRETGLLVRQLATRETVLNALPEQVDYEDYRDVGGGLKLPFKITVSAIDTYNSSRRTFTEIRTNVPVDETIFAMPATPPKP